MTEDANVERIFREAPHSKHILRTVISFTFATGHCLRIPNHEMILPELFDLTSSLPDTNWSHKQGERGKLKTWFCLGEPSWIFLICSRPDSNHFLWLCSQCTMTIGDKWVLEPHNLSSNPHPTASWYDIKKVVWYQESYLNSLCLSFLTWKMGQY